MAKKVIMPKQGLQMTEGTIIKWLVGEGEPVVVGKPLFEMETDKLTITMDAEADGVLLKIVRPEGDVVPITETIAVIGKPGEDISALLAPAASATPATPAAPKAAATPSAPAQASHTGRIFISPRAKMVAEELHVDYSGIAGTGLDGSIIERDVRAFAAANTVSASPLARKLAEQGNVALANVTGSGAHGKIMAADIRSAAEAPAAAPETAPPSGRGVRRVAMDGMRKAIAKNMLTSKENNAQTSMRICVDMASAIALRQQYKALGIKLSYNDIIVRACAKALTDCPAVNASVDGSDIVYHDYVHIGTAVAVDNGLIVPVIRDADVIGLAGIAEQSVVLIEKARSGGLLPDDYHGGTFTVSSLGMFGVDDFVAIINPPESAILAVGKIAKVPVVATSEAGEDEVVIRSVCSLCLSYDHRVIDGAEAARFLQNLQKYLQTPILLI